jgi:hypothetical protein
MKNDLTAIVILQKGLSWLSWRPQKHHPSAVDRLDLRPTEKLVSQNCFRALVAGGIGTMFLQSFSSTLAMIEMQLIKKSTQHHDSWQHRKNFSSATNELY